jgi:hypothetical protein
MRFGRPIRNGTDAHIQGLTVKTVELKTMVARRLTDVQAIVSSTKLVDRTFPVRCQRSKKEAMSASIIKRVFLTHPAHPSALTFVQSTVRRHSQLPILPWLRFSQPADDRRTLNYAQHSSPFQMRSIVAGDRLLCSQPPLSLSIYHPDVGNMHFDTH